MRRGGARGGRRRRGDTYVARARERVCVRLINQTFAFGCRREVAEAEVEVPWWKRRKRSRRTEKQAAATGGPGRVVHEAESGQAKPGYATPGQAPTLSLCASPSLRLSLSRAISVSLLRVHPPYLSLSLSVFFLCLPVCLPASACRSVGRSDPASPSPRVPSPRCALTLARCLPAPLTRLGNVSLARGINTPVGRLRAAKRPKPRSRKRRRLYRVTPRARVRCTVYSLRNRSFGNCSNRSAHPGSLETTPFIIIRRLYFHSFSPAFPLVLLSFLFSSPFVRSLVSVSSRLSVSTKN